MGSAATLVSSNACVLTALHRGYPNLIAERLMLEICKPAHFHHPIKLAKLLGYVLEMTVKMMPV